MKIVVLGQTVETTEIFDIVEVEHGKKNFLNREAGFILKLIDKPDMIFKQDIPYESYASEIVAIKKDWKKLQDEVFEKWKLDTTDLQTFRL